MLYNPGMALKIITIEDNSQDSILKQSMQVLEFPLKTEDRELIAAMKDWVVELEGVGLAAPQVNANKAVAVIYIPASAALLRDNAIETPLHVLINPSYQPIITQGKAIDFEACYSVRSRCGKVPRYQAIELRYQDESGRWHELEATGFYARVCQHEIDHLNGVLITDRLTPDCVQGSMAEMLEMRRQELSPEQRHHLDELIEKKFSE